MALTSTYSVKFTGDISSLSSMFDSMASQGDTVAGSISENFSKAAGGMSDAMATAADAIRTSLAEAAEGGGSAEELQAKFTELAGTIDTSIAGAMDEFKSQVDAGMASATVGVDAFKDKYTSAMLQLELASKEAAASTDEIAASSDLSAGFSSIASKLSGLTKDVPMVGSAFSAMADKTKKADVEASGFGDTLAGVGKIATIAGAAIFTVAAVEGVKAVSTFQQSAAQLASAAGISEKAATNIGNAFKGVDGTQDANALTKAYAGIAGQLGNVEKHSLTAGEAVQVMQAATDLSDAKMGDLTETTDALSTVMQAYGLSAKDAASTSDTLYGISTKTGLSLSSVTSSVQRMHSQLGAATPSLQDVGALMNDLAVHGETGKQSMSAVNTAMTTLLKTTSTSASKNGELKTSMTAAGEEAKKLGVNVYGSNGQFVGMQSIIEQLQPKLAGMTQQQQLQTVQTLFGATAGRKLLDVVMAGPSAYQASADAVNKAGSAHAAAGAQMDTLSGATGELKKDIGNLVLTFGQDLIPVLTKVADAIKDAAQWFQQHKAVAEVLAGVIGGVLLVAIGAYIVALAAAAAAQIAAAAVPLLIIAALVALGAAIYELITHWSTVWGAIKDIAEDVWHFLDGVWNDIKNDTLNIWNDIIDFFKSVGPLILDIMSGGILPLVQFLVDHWQQISHDVSAWWGDIESFFKRWWPEIIGIMTGGVGLLPALMVKYWKQIENDASALWGDIERVFSTGLHDVESAVSTGVSSVVSFFAGLPARTMNGLSRLGSDMLSFGKSIITDLLRGIEAVAGDIGAYFESMIGWIGNIVKSWAGDLVQWGRDIIGWMVQGIESAAGGLGNAVTGIVDKIPGASFITKHLAEGGIITQPTFAEIGEAGYPEAVVPLKWGMSAAGIGQALDNFFSVGTGSGLGFGSGMSSPSPISMSTNKTASGVTQQVVINAVTNANASQIASETTWALGRLAAS